MKYIYSAKGKKLLVYKNKPQDFEYTTKSKNISWRRNNWNCRG